MNIVGVVSSKEQADELTEISKIFVVAKRVRVLAIKSVLMNEVGLKTLKKVC